LSRARDRGRAPRLERMPRGLAPASALRGLGARRDAVYGARVCAGRCIRLRAGNRGTSLGAPRDVSRGAAIAPADARGKSQPQPLQCRRRRGLRGLAPAGISRGAIAGPDERCDPGNERRARYGGLLLQRVSAKKSVETGTSVWNVIARRLRSACNALIATAFGP